MAIARSPICNLLFAHRLPPQSHKRVVTPEVDAKLIREQVTIALHDEPATVRMTDALGDHLGSHPSRRHQTDGRMPQIVRNERVESGLGPLGERVVGTPLTSGCLASRIPDASVEVVSTPGAAGFVAAAAGARGNDVAAGGQAEEGLG